MTTFISAFIDLQEKNRGECASNRYFAHFESLAATGIPLCVITSRNYGEKIAAIARRFVNVRLMGVLSLSDTWTFKAATRVAEVPGRRNPAKDTFNYLVNANAKIEYVQGVINENPFATRHFAWIDFGIFHVFKDPPASAGRLRRIASGPLTDRLLAFPGCWEKGIGLERIADQVCWRFCGGFFLGDRESLLDMWSRWQSFFPEFISQRGRIAWEVNLWAAMESFAGWSPDWYAADHDDRIIRLPDRFFLRDAPQRLPGESSPRFVKEKRSL